MGPSGRSTRRGQTDRLVLERVHVAADRADELDGDRMVARADVRPLQPRQHRSINTTGRRSLAAMKRACGHQAARLLEKTGRAGGRAGRRDSNSLAQISATRPRGPTRPSQLGAVRLFGLLAPTAALRAVRAGPSGEWSGRTSVTRALWPSSVVFQWMHWSQCGTFGRSHCARSSHGGMSDPRVGSRKLPDADPT